MTTPWNLLYYEMKKMSVEDQVELAIDKLGWEPDDDIRVDIGGCSVTGTETHEDANPKWSKPKGTVTYQKDAFITIKNDTRSPFEPSKSPED